MTDRENPIRPSAASFCALLLVLLLATTGRSEETDPERDPFEPTPVLEEAARRSQERAPDAPGPGQADSRGDATPAVGVRLSAYLELEGRPAAALLEVDGRTLLVRAGDRLTWTGPAGEVEATVTGLADGRVRLRVGETETFIR